jgi:lipopolysaccharide/colanic/teichoic acid biosynthesis glycosyltransferase
VYKRGLKRVLDVIIAFFGLLILSPLFLLITVALSVTSGQPFFLQRRPGKDNRIFTLIKFRTMNERKDENGQLLPDSQRITSLGKFLRTSSLDEIPQLWNVLTGDMSLIGPRPLLPEYLPLYTPEQARRHEVRPGITGWAQVNGRNSINWQEKFRLDVCYVDKLSFGLDMKIAFLTLRSILKGEGSESSDWFTGDKE